MISSLLEAFAEVTLWIPSDYEAILVASDRPLTVDWARWQREWAQPRVASSLMDVGFTSPYGLLGTYVAGTEALKRYARGYPAMTDDHPRVEYFLFNADHPFDPEELLAVGEPPDARLTGAGELDAKRLALEREANQRVLESTRFKMDRDWEAARASVEKARAAVCDNPFLTFLRELELDCLRPRESARP
jgi:hypothetical protein